MGGSTLGCMASASASCPDFLKPLFDGFADPLAQLSHITCHENSQHDDRDEQQLSSLTNCVEDEHLLRVHTARCCRSNNPM